MTRAVRTLALIATAAAAAVTAAAPSSNDLLLTMQISRRLTQDQLMRQAAYVLATEATTDSDGYPLPPAPAEGAGPSGGGVIPSSSAAPKTDGYGVSLGYCAWDNGSVTSHAGYIAGTASLGAVTFAVISPGADNAFQTTCAQIAAGQPASGDDSVVAYTSGQILAGVQGTTYFADAVNTAADLTSIATSALKDGQVRLVKSTNTLYRYSTSTGWTMITTPWQAGATAGDLYYNAGNVSLGTATPRRQLTVQSSAVPIGIASTGTRNGIDLLDTSGNANGFVGFDGGLNQLRLEALKNASSALVLSTPGGSVTVDAAGVLNAPQGLTTSSLTSTGALSATNGSFSGTVTSATGSISGTLTAGTVNAGAMNVNNNAVWHAGNLTPGNYVLKSGDTMTGLLTTNGGISSTTGNFSSTLTANGGLVSSAVTTGIVGTTSASPLQLITNNTQRLTIDASGKVGIAKAAPSYPLDVWGSIRADNAGGFTLASGGGTTVGQLWYDVAAPRVILEATGSSMNLSFYTNLLERMRITPAGNIGIGTSTPGSTLDVSGTANISGALTAGSITSTGLLMANGGLSTTGTVTAGTVNASAVNVGGNAVWHAGNLTPSNYVLKAGDTMTGLLTANGGVGATTTLQLLTAGSERMRIDSSGRVGIGTSAPGATLDVSGTANISGALTAGSITSTGLLTANGGLSTTGTVTAGTVNASAVNVGGNAVWHAGNLTPSNYVLKAGDTMTGLLTANGGVGATTTLQLLTGGSERMRIDSSGNVGIGTTAPAAKFHLVDATSGTHARFADGTIKLDIGSVTGSYAFVGTNTNHPLVLTTSNVERLRIDTSGNVGIGTTSPATRLHLVTAAAGAQARFNDGTITTDLGTVASTNAYFGTTSAHALSLKTNNLDRLYITSSGNVGIGTASPGAALDVTGTANVSGALAAGSFSSSGNGSFGSVTTGTIGTATATPLLFNTNSVERLRIDSAGNVGIGLTSGLAAKFTVRNGGGFDTLIDSGANHDNYLTAGSAGVNIFRHGSTEDARFDSSGNLGIGKTAPGYKLDVLGAIRSDSSGNSAGFWLGNGSGTNVGQFWYDPTTTPPRAVVEARGATTNLSFATNGAERMRIDTGGRVGIGGAAPGGSFMLGVTGAAFVTSTLTAASVGTDTGLFYSNGNIPLILQGGAKEGLRIDNNTGYVGIGTTTPATQLDVGGTVRANGPFTVWDGTTTWGSFSQNSVGPTLEANGTLPLLLVTNSAIAVRINSNGNVGVGLNPSYKLDVNGVAHATSFSTASDARLKHDIATLIPDETLRRFLQVRPVHYVLNSSGRQNYGYIAQELLPLFPEMVTQGSDGLYGVEYTQMLPILTSVVQQQQQALQHLQATKLDNLVGQWSTSSDHRGRFLFEDGGKTVLKGYGDTAVEIRNGDDAAVASFNRNGDLALSGLLRFNGPSRNGLAFDATGTIVSSDTPGQIVVSASRAARAAVRLQSAPDAQASNARIYGSLFGDDTGVGIADASGHALLTARSTPAGGQVTVSGALVVGDPDGASSTIRLAGQAAIQAPGDGSLVLAASNGVRIFNPLTKEAAVTLGSDGTVQARTFVPTKVVDSYGACSGQAGAIARDASGQIMVCMQ